MILLTCDLDEATWTSSSLQRSIISSFIYFYSVRVTSPRGLAGDSVCSAWPFVQRAALLYSVPPALCLLLFTLSPWLSNQKARDFSLSNLLEFTFCTSLWLDFTCATAWLYRRNSLSSDFRHAAKTLSWVSTHRVAAALVTPPHSFNSCLSFFPFSFFHLSLLLVLDEKLETAHINSTKQTQSWLKQKRWSQSSAHRTGTPR